MSIKKKLGLGVASAALGLSLVGGGTWAAFNDVETLDNSFAAGTLDLGLSAGNTELLNFDLSNLKPGDQMLRSFKLSNDGSLAIKEVWMDVAQSNFLNGTNEFVDEHGQTDNDALAFLDQFKVEILRTGVEGGNLGAPFDIINSGDNVTLRDLVEGTNLPSGGEFETGANGNVTRINLAPTNTQSPDYNGLPADPRDYEVVEIKISMIDDQTRITDTESPAYNEFTQNKYQGDSIDLNLEFEATQWEGLNTEQTQNNGYLEVNEEANSN
ncbi:CalY family protein [Aquibacillus sp. 3ASR75-11]|uniref:CalY family protein n=1 Tax=Terrihalobacillus insolitus TaxID=2950438 RepID=A0A9X3WWC4_9BACI|nr:TasA family protein [Terrihalobacillus insolitus]MDC3413624.1 CalY family protein [Terrihalobacillus insolitus]MDC3424619.1 CalY family protein [Terrihalobacillus insolitus]